MLVKREILTDVPDLAERIKAARKSSGKTVKALAEASGMTEMNWFKLEDGTIKTITEDRLRQVEKALGVEFNVQFHIESNQL